MSQLTSDNKNVHSLWIGNSLSPLELLTIKSFISAGHIFNLWVYEPIPDNLPKEVICRNASEIIPQEMVFKYKFQSKFGHGKGSYAGFSDIFRYKLLYEHGGWWVDMDVTCLKPLNFNNEYIFRKHHSLLVVGNIMKCPPKSKLMSLCYEEASSEVNENNRDWHKPIQILNKHINALHLNSFITDMSNEDRWLMIRKLLLKDVNIPENWNAIHWVNVEWTRNKINKSEALDGSLYYNLLKQHEINISLVNNKDIGAYKRKLSFVSALFRQIF